MPIAVGLLFVPRADMVEHLSGSAVIVGVGGLAVLWLLIAETRYLIRDLKTNAARALGIAAGSLALSAVIVGSLMVGTLHVLLHAHLLLPHP